MTEKEKTIYDVEKEIMNDADLAEIDESIKINEMAQNAKLPEISKNIIKSPELPGMPERTPFENQAVVVMDVWSDLGIIKKILKNECNKLLPLMKKEGRCSVILRNSSNDKIEIKLTNSNEKIQINKKGA